MITVKNLARELARTNGYDPDEEVRGGIATFAARDKDKTGHAVANRGPAWLMYRQKAREMITLTMLMGQMPAPMDWDQS